MNLKKPNMIIWSYIHHDKHDNDTLPGDIAVYM